MSRSVKPDYEKAKNPGNTRIWGLQGPYKVTQCRCNQCLKRPYRLRDYNIRTPEGPILYTVTTWKKALWDAILIYAPPAPRRTRGGRL